MRVKSRIAGAKGGIGWCFWSLDCWRPCSKEQQLHSDGTKIKWDATVGMILDIHSHMHEERALCSILVSDESDGRTISRRSHTSICSEQLPKFLFVTLPLPRMKCGSRRVLL